MYHDQFSFAITGMNYVWKYIKIETFLIAKNININISQLLFLFFIVFFEW